MILHYRLLYEIHDTVDAVFKRRTFQRIPHGKRRIDFVACRNARAVENLSDAGLFACAVSELVNPARSDAERGCRYHHVLPAAARVLAWLKRVI